MLQRRGIHCRWRTQLTRPSTGTTRQISTATTRTTGLLCTWRRARATLALLRSSWRTTWTWMRRPPTRGPHCTLRASEAALTLSSCSFRRAQTSTFRTLTRTRHSTMRRSMGTGTYSLLCCRIRLILDCKINRESQQWMLPSPQES